MKSLIPPRFNMPNRDDIVRIQHMIEAANEAKDILGDTARENLPKNKTIANAVVRSLEVLGEAASKLSEGFQKEHASVPWKKIIVMRNRLIHAYFDINYDIVFATVKEDIPAILPQLQKIIEDEHAAKKPANTDVKEISSE
jgi:uncharacterized protein with HEPN domain